MRGASPATRAELMSKFYPSTERQHHDQLTSEDPSMCTSHSETHPSPAAPAAPAAATHMEPRQYSRHSLGTGDYATLLLNSASAVPIPNTPSSLLPHSKALPAEKDDGGPFKAEMVARMEHLEKGDRILPPCDRCRRLHMDCEKNLTACKGCTKKHAKCAWREVKEEEMFEGREGHGDDGDDEDDNGDAHAQPHEDLAKILEQVEDMQEASALTDRRLINDKIVTDHSPSNEADGVQANAAGDKEVLDIHTTPTLLEGQERENIADALRSQPA